MTTWGHQELIGAHLKAHFQRDQENAQEHLRECRALIIDWQAASRRWPPQTMFICQIHCFHGYRQKWTYGRMSTIGQILVDLQRIRTTGVHYWTDP